MVRGAHRKSTGGNGGNRGVNFCWLRLLLLQESVSPKCIRCSRTASELTETIIAAAIEVHRDKGPGLIESIYEWCLAKEFELRGLTCVSQKLVMIEYKGFTREEPLRFDMLVEGGVVVEAKAVEKILPIH